jgi:hypothetical protein
VFPTSHEALETMGLGGIAMQVELNIAKPFLFHHVECSDSDATDFSPGAIDESVVVQKLAT